MNVKNMLRPGADAAPRALLLHRVWMIFGITGMGCCVGLVSLLAAAFSYGKLNGYAIFASYFMHPLIALLNLSVSVGLMWLFYFLTGRAWGGFLGSYLPTMGLTLVNYYKIRLRSDPLLAADLRLAAEAKGIMGGYTLDFTWVIGVTLLCFAAGLLGSILLLPGRWRDRGGRLFGLISAASLLAVAFWGQYTTGLTPTPPTAASSTPGRTWRSMSPRAVSTPSSTPCGTCSLPRRRAMTVSRRPPFWVSIPMPTSRRSGRSMWWASCWRPLPT